MFGIIKVECNRNMGFLVDGAVDVVESVLQVENLFSSSQFLFILKSVYLNLQQILAVKRLMKIW